MRSNIKSMSKELILFLEKSDYEFKSICSSNLCICAEKYAPSTKWHIDTMIRVLTTSGNYVRDDVVGNLIQLISDANSLHSYAVQQLWLQLILKDLENKQPLVQVAMWTLGEFADLLNVPYVDETTILTNEVEQPLNISEDKVIDICEEVLTNNLMNIVAKEYTIETLMKLSVRFPSHAPRVKKLLDFYCCHMNIELQQRAVEFCKLFTKHSSLRPSLLEKMPPLPKLNRKERENEKEENQFTNGDLLNESLGESKLIASNKNSNALLDLLGNVIGDLDSSSIVNNNLNSKSATVNDETTSNNILDLLSGLDLSGGNANNLITANNLILNDKIDIKANNTMNQLNDLFGNEELKLDNKQEIKSILNDDPFAVTSNLDQTSTENSLTSSTSNLNTINAIEKNGLKIVFNFEKNKDTNSPITIHLEASNQNSSNITDFLFQAAVPNVGFNNL